MSHRGWHPPANVGRFRYGTRYLEFPERERERQRQTDRERERERERLCFVPIWFPYEYAETAST